MPSNIVVPEVGESIVDARVAKWLRKEGDAVSVGDPLVELETDKVDLEVAAPQGGVLKIGRKDGDDVKVGDVLGSSRTRRAGAARADGEAVSRSAGGEASAESDQKPATGTDALDADRAQGGRRSRCRSQPRARQRRRGAGHAAGRRAGGRRRWKRSDARRPRTRPVRTAGAGRETRRRRNLPRRACR